MHKFAEVSIVGKSSDIEARREAELILARLPYLRSHDVGKQDSIP